MLGFMKPQYERRCPILDSPCDRAGSLPQPAIRRPTWRISPVQVIALGSARGLCMDRTSTFAPYAAGDFGDLSPPSSCRVPDEFPADSTENPRKLPDPG